MNLRIYGSISYLVMSLPCYLRYIRWPSLFKPCPTRPCTRSIGEKQVVVHVPLDNTHPLDICAVVYKNAGCTHGNTVVQSQKGL